MNDTRTAAPVLCPSVWPGTPVAPAKAARRHFGLEGLQNILATWEERKRFRWDLARMTKDNPHLIDDIGLTRRQVEAEIAKPFWRE